MMSIDTRYQGFLCDLLTLLDQMAVRTLTKSTLFSKLGQIDLEKFKYFFNKFFDRMQALQPSFHSSRPKLTHYLRRTKATCEPNESNNKKYETIQPSSDEYHNNECIPKPFVRSISTGKPTHVSRQLISIQEEADQYRTPKNNRRSQTATGVRRSSLGNQEQFRPKTGHAGGRKRYVDSHKVAKTINITEQAFRNTEQSIPSREQNRIHFVLNDREIRQKRKSFYLDLQKEKSKDGEVFSQKQCKEIFKKYKGKANQRIWQKINRLI